MVLRLPLGTLAIRGSVPEAYGQACPCRWVGASLSQRTQLTRGGRSYRDQDVRFQVPVPRHRTGPVACPSFTRPTAQLDAANVHQRVRPLKVC